MLITNFTTGGFWECEGELDTFHFRDAIEKYVEKLMGIYHEDYNYSIMNKLINDDLKKFIKSVLFSSKELTRADISKLDLPFNNRDLLQLIITVVNLKERISLTYIAYAYDSYLKDIN